MKFIFGLCSDKGKQKAGNQDRLLIKIGESETIGEFAMFVVADGMGGMTDGGRASEMAVDSLKNWWDNLSEEQIMSIEQISSDLYKQFFMINSAIKNYGDLKGISTGTTLSAVFVAGNKYVLCHIGDSRVYKFNGYTLQQLTIDHSYVAEQVKMGLISAAEARHHPMKNIITQCLGVNDDIEPYENSGTIASQEVLILCSDGLYNEVSEEQIITEVAGGLGSMPAAQRTAERLLQMANDNGGNDNISVIVARDFLTESRKGFGIFKRGSHDFLKHVRRNYIRFLRVVI